MNGLNIQFWQLLVLMGASGLLPVIGVIIGAWFVFKTKHAQLNIPFLQNPLSRTADSEVASYVSGMFNTDETPELDDDELSEAARRIGEQRHPTAGQNLASVMGR